MTEMGGALLCKFEAPNTLSCVAFADPRSPRGYYYAHEEIYLHDCAVAFNRILRQVDRAQALRWADGLGLPVARVIAIADALPLRARAIALEIR